MTLAEICVRRPVFATMLILFLVVLGIFSFMDLGVDLFPKADPPIVSVRVRLPGASPDEMTSQVILPIEEQLRDRKSTRLNSSHLGISYAVFCLKKKKNKKQNKQKANRHGTELTDQPR